MLRDTHIFWKVFYLMQPLFPIINLELKSSYFSSTVKIFKVIKA